MKFARYTFLIAGVYGLLALLPMYLLESRYGVDNPPEITHPEFYYGFIGVAAAFQLVFIVISRDPIKYKALIFPSIVEKFSFVIAIAALVIAGRVSGQIIIGAAIDAILGTLFTIAHFRISRVKAGINR
jgi:hypothetical protein